MKSTINRGLFFVILCGLALFAHSKDAQIPVFMSDKLNNYLHTTKLFSKDSRLDSIAPLMVSINDVEGWLVLWDIVEQSSMQDKAHRVGLFAASANPADYGNGLLLSGISTASIEEPHRFARLVGQMMSLSKSEPTTFFLSIYTILSGSGSSTLATDLIVHLDPDTWALSVIKDFGVTGRFNRSNIASKRFQNTSFVVEETSAHDVLLIKRSKEDNHASDQCFRVSDRSVSSLDCLGSERNRRSITLLRPFDEFLKLSIDPAK
jgi:hypothetical protein